MEIVSLPATSVSAELAEHAATLHKRCFNPGWNGAAFQSLLGTSGVNLILICKLRGLDQLAGLLLVREIADEAEILTLCVDPQYRGKGLGAQMVNRMMADFHRQGIKDIFLEVAENNEAALRLYEQCGFQVLGLRRAYYADGQTAVMMRHADKV